MATRRRGPQHERHLIHHGGCGLLDVRVAVFALCLALPRSSIVLLLVWVPWPGIVLRKQRFGEKKSRKPLIRLLGAALSPLEDNDGARCPKSAGAKHGVTTYLYSVAAHFFPRRHDSASLVRPRGCHCRARCTDAGRLPPQLKHLLHLQELSLPGNKLFGEFVLAINDFSTILRLFLAVLARVRPADLVSRFHVGRNHHRDGVRLAYAGKQISIYSSVGLERKAWALAQEGNLDGMREGERTGGIGSKTAQSFISRFTPCSPFQNRRKGTRGFVGSPLPASGGAPWQQF